MKTHMHYKTHLLTAAAVAALAFCNHAAVAQTPKSTAAPATATSSPAAKAPRAIPLRGTASAVDQAGKTFTIAGKSSSRVFKATDQTTITKAGNSATFADLTDNEPVTGSYWKKDDGTLELKSLKIGGKTDAEKAKSSTKKSKKKKTDADEEETTAADE
jgi:hypothetical protein